MAEQKSEDHITMANIDNLTEDELRRLEELYKEQCLPMHRLLMLIPFNLAIMGGAMYYTININHYRKRLFSPKNYKFGQIVKYGTIQTLAFLTVYLGGTALISGLYNPVEYLRGLAKIKGKQIDNSLQFDPFFQKHVLFSMLDFFGLSDKLVSQIQTEIQDKKTKLENSNYFSEDTKKHMNEKQD
ncbi:hypothetical protein pb186bvf_002904 [Paramecium bursaria]